MSTIEGNGSLTFGDGTTLTSGTIPFSSVSGLPTRLSQFTNNLPTPAGMISGVTTGQIGGVGGVSLAMYLNGSNQLYLSIGLANCYCNC